MTTVVDRSEIARFVAALLSHATIGSYLSLRAFRDDEDGVWGYEHWATAQVETGDFDNIIEAAAKLAARCAEAPVPVCFAPPVCTFSSRDKADTDHLVDGLVITAELDHDPAAGRARLEAALGLPPTVALESGGLWCDPATGEAIPKQHAHWRLAKPTTNKIEHDFLREINELAKTVAGGDPTAIALVHPVRWPGSLHSKAEPRLARIVAYNPEVEIELADALAKLRAAVEAPHHAPGRKRANGGKLTLIKGGRANGSDDGDQLVAQAELLDICAALAVIPNDDSGSPQESWDRWNNMGMRIYAALGDTETAEGVWTDWSRRCKTKFDEDKNRARWQHIVGHPPNRTGPDAIFKMAREAWSGWEKPSAIRQRRDNDPGEPPPRLIDPPFPEPSPDPAARNDIPPVPEPVLPEGVQLEDFYGYMPQHNYMYAPSREPWPAASVNARIKPIQVGVDGDGEPVLISASRWVDQNQPVEQMTWAPGLPMIIKDRLISEGGWIRRKKVSIFNLYRPPVLAHGNPEDAGRWVAHVEMVYPENADHIIKWLAHRVQRPQDKINHALVLGGFQGIGKDSLIEPAKRAVGPWNVAEPSPKQLLEKFNGFTRSVILRINEARDLGDIDRYQFYEHLKVYTAAPPDVIRVNEKHLREYNLLNCCGVIITTNHQTDGIYLPADDRRHYVSWSFLTKEDFTQDYWDDLWGFYDNGGDRHVAAYLAQLDLSGFNPKAPPPKTTAFWDIVNASRAPEDAELADILELLRTPDVVTLSSVILKAGEAGEQDFIDWLKDRKNRRNLLHRFEACGYVSIRNPDAEDGLWKITGRRQVVYAKAGLTLHEQLAAVRDLLERRERHKRGQ